MSYLRLRQICLVARDLPARADELRYVFQLGEGHSEPSIAGLGLRNVVIPMGRSPVFMEIVSPITEGTTAGRYLTRRSGDGGYMYIVDDSDHEAAKARTQALDIRLITDRVWDDEPTVRNIQLHPGDTGGTMIEIDQHGAGADMLGPYRWAGADWNRHLRTDVVQAVLGAEIQSPDPRALAKRWAAILSRPLTVDSDTEPMIALDNAFVRFTTLGDDRGEGLSVVCLEVDDLAGALSRARELGLPQSADQIVICGVRFKLTAR